MAISRVPGFSLLSNLDRQGVDLQFTTDSNALVYMDFTNFRFGVNTTVPQQTLEVNGNVLVANGHVLTSANLTYDLGDNTNWWRKIYVGDVVAANLSIGNVTISGNTTSGIIYAEAVYDSNHRVLTTNTTFTLSGDVTGTGMYSNIAVTINNSGVAAGIYGDDGQIPQIAVNSKGLVTSLANIALTRISNIYVSNTTVYTASGNIILGPAAGYIFANNSIISNVANPVNYQDVVTVNYLNSAITANRYAIQLDNSSITIRDDGTNPGWIVTQVDSNVTANITSLATEFYTKVNIGNLTFNNRTISSAGNILLDAQGTGIVQILGSDAFGLPYGGDGARPANPEVGYTRFNTDRTSIETWDGTSWEGPNEFTITSEVINPDGASNVYTLTSNATTVGVMVNINGTIQQPTTAYNIINNNQIQFTEIPLTTDIIEVRHIAAGAVTVSSLSYNPTELYLDSANVNVTGNILPTANTTYSLGSSSLQWKDLYVSGNSIYMGGTALTISNGVLLVGNAPVSASSVYGNVNVAAYTQTMGYTNYSNVNVAAYVTTNGLTNYSNVNVAAYTQTQSFTNYSNVNVAAYTQTQSYTNYSNVNVAAYVTTNGLTNYSNVNVAAYTQTQSYTNYSNVNLSAYLGGAVTIGGNLTIQGNLFVNGNLTTINANNLSISDSMIYLADDNPADTLDIGIVSAFTSAVRYQHTGFVRDASDGVWKLFANVVAEPTTTVDFSNANYSSLMSGNLMTTNDVRIGGNTLFTNGGYKTLAVGGSSGGGWLQFLTNGSAGPYIYNTSQNLILWTDGGDPKITLNNAANKSVEITSANVDIVSGNARVSGNLTVTGNVTFSGWSIKETNNKLYFAYNGINKMSLDTGGNLVVTGDITAFGTIT